MKTSIGSKLVILGATAFVSSVLTLFVKNFISGEKKIKKSSRGGMTPRAGSSSGR